MMQPWMIWDIERERERREREAEVGRGLWLPPPPPPSSVPEPEKARPSTRRQQMSNQPARFIVCATCNIKGSSLEGIETRLWYGKNRASAEKVLARKCEEYGSLYRDWRVLDTSQ